jgi:acyl-coenzyme A thioesterase PaaI-like protein
VSFFHPARVGTRITGTGRVIKRGRRVLFAEAEVTDEDGKLLAKASGTEIPSDVTKR